MACAKAPQARTAFLMSQGHLGLISTNRRNLESEVLLLLQQTRRYRRSMVATCSSIWIMVLMELSAQHLNTESRKIRQLGTLPLMIWSDC